MPSIRLGSNTGYLASLSFRQCKMGWKTVLSLVVVNMVMNKLGADVKEPKLLHRVYTDEYEFSFYGYHFTQSQAIQECSKRNSFLAKIDSSGITNVVIPIIQKPWQYRIGASDEHKEGDWEWTDGTPVKNNTKNTNWDDGEPNNSGDGEDCATVVHGGKWNDIPCNDNLSFICQKGLSTEVLYKTHVFKFHRASNKKASFLEAQHRCELEEARLAEIHNKDVDNAIRQKLEKRNVFFWTAGSDLKREGQWRWNNMTVITHRGWRNGEPNGTTNENCLAISYDGWVDHDCSKKFAYICETVGVHDVTTSQVNFEVGKHEGFISCYADGQPTPMISWMLNGTEVTFSSSDSVYQTRNKSGAWLHTSRASVKDEGVYNCLASNNVGTKKYRANISSSVAVPSTPTILEVKVDSCNRSLEISWMPNKRALQIPHRVTVMNIKTKHEIFNANSVEGKPISSTLIIPNLLPWTYYNVSVMPCPSATVCKFQYSVSTKVLSVGIPGNVTNIAVIATSSNSCEVTWNKPSIINGTNNVSYQLKVIEALREAPIGYNGSDEKILFVNYESYKFDGKPNRKYSFGIRAKTCLGIGPLTTAKQSCNTSMKEPNFLPSPTVHHSINSEGQVNVTLHLPDQSNGPLSCIFLILTIFDEYGNKFKPSYSLKTLKEANKSITNSTKREHIFVALEVPRYQDETVIILGNGSLSRCDINATRYRMKNSIRNNSTFVGQNCKLDPTKTYSIFALSTTPTGKDVLLKTSDVQQLNGEKLSSTTQDDGSTKSILGIILGVAGVFLIAFIIAGITYWIKRNPRKGIGNHRPLCKEENQLEKNQQREITERKVTYQNASMQNDDEGEPDRTNINFSSISEEDQHKQNWFITETTVKYQNTLVQTEVAVPDGTSIMMKGFENYFRVMQKDNGKTFVKQFKELTDEANAKKGPTEVAAKPENKKKNRYKNILPFDTSRVVVRNSDSGYINACFVDGFHNESKFIAAQGPLSNTVIDFWLMIVEQKSTVIVMLAKCFEAGKRKCEKYWPDQGEITQYGSIVVRNKEEIKFCGFIKRTFIVKGDQTEMLVHQYHFNTWPDHSIPATTSQLLRMHRYIMQTQRSFSPPAPIVIHCSAGAGRTGTFIAYDNLLNQSQAMQSVDVYNCILKMREQRVDMVQNCDQYILVHKLLLESYMFGDTDLSVEEAKQKLCDIDYRLSVSTVQFSNLSRFEPMKISVQNIPEKISLYDRMKVVVVTGERDESLTASDASHLESYDESRKLIAASNPTRESAECFWTIILNYHVTVVVTLSTENSDDVYCWPNNETEPLKFREINVYLHNVEENGSFEKTAFIVEGFGRRVETVRLRYTTRQNYLPGDGNKLIALISEMQKILRGTSFPSALIHCRNGVGMTGAFCAIVNLIDRLNLENRVDVFRAVKDLRDCRQGMVETLDQYILCHQAIVDYLNSFCLYGNFM